MAERYSTCDRESLELFLSDKLADADRLTLEEHLSGCHACRDEIEQLAAGPALWSEVRDYLSSAGEEPALLQVSTPAVPGAFDAKRDEAADVPRVEHILGFLSRTDDPRMLGRFGGYEIAGIVGCGGMGVVLKGLDVALNRYVAIKALAPHLATSAAARQRFAREAQAAAAVVHENVIAIHAVSEANGLPYLVMPYMRGPSLQKRLDAQGALTIAEILRIGRQVAAGLAAAHAQGLVHRDIKPGNILLEDGVELLRITDFGLARAADDASLTRSGVIAGTPQYMSPEQARGDSLDARSDLFSLGSVLYALCTGHPPFRAETSFGVLRRITDETPRPIGELNPEIPGWLAATIAKLHAKEPAARYGSADEVARLFEQCLAHIQQPTLVPLPESLPTKPASSTATTRRPTWRLAGLAAGLALAAAAAFQFSGKSPAHKSDSGSPAQGSAGPDSARTSTDSRYSEATRWEDGTDAQFRELQADVSSLEAQTATDGSSH